MRIRNSRSLISLLEGRNFDERFLVEEVNRHIGWPIWRARTPRSPGIKGDQLCDDSKSMVTGEIKAPNHKDEKKGENHSIQEKSSQASKEENGNKADAGNKSNMLTDYQEDGSSCEVVVDSTIAPTSSCSRPGEVLPIKKRRNYYQLVAETTIMEDEHTSNMHEQKECATPQNESLQEHEIIAEMLPEETVIEAIERRRSGRKRKSQYHSFAENHLFEFNKIEERGRPKRLTANRNNWCEEMPMAEGGSLNQVEDEERKPNRGRPKRVNDHQPTFKIVLALPAVGRRKPKTKEEGGQ